MFSQDILIIGFGAQAKAWALNLRDSKRSVSILLRDGSPSKAIAERMNFKVISSATPVISDFKFLCLLIPDDQHLGALENISQFLRPEQKIIYAHGFSVTYEDIQNKFSKQQHLLLAPKAIASEVRFNYETKRPLTAAISTEFAPEAEQELFQLADDLGINVGPFQSSFKEETQADLFSEQSLLCSILPYAAKASFDKLIEQGISKEIAYIECWHEVKLIANAMLEFGPSGFFDLISPNALIGGQKAVDQLISPNYLKVLNELFNEIESGKFFQEIKSTNFQSIKSEVLNNWKDHPLQKTYDQLGVQLRTKK